MDSVGHKFEYLGAFLLNEHLCQPFVDYGAKSKTPVQPTNGRIEEGSTQRTIEEKLIDSAELAQINGEIVLEGSDGTLSPISVELLLRSGSLQFRCSDSAVPFERIPFHKIEHIVAFENGRGAQNVLIVERFPDIHRGASVSRCHLFQASSNEGDAGVEEFCAEFRQKFEEISAKLD